jgi:hypothetical protein
MKVCLDTVMDKQETNDYEYCSCIWCGQWISKATYAKRIERKLGDADVCKDCRDVRRAASIKSRKDKKWEHPTLGFIYCVIWDGDLNDDWLPIDDEGGLFRPGLRICGLKDCINSSHVIKPAVATVSDIDVILMSMEVRAKHKKVGQIG